MRSYLITIEFSDIQNKTCTFDILFTWSHDALMQTELTYLKNVIVLGFKITFLNTFYEMIHNERKSFIHSFNQLIEM